MDIWLGVDSELEEYRRIVDSLRRTFIASESRISEVIAFIGSVQYEEAAVYFDELHLIQRRIAVAKYKFDFPIETRLEDFVYHMDRDDDFSRRYWHRKFSGGMRWPEDAS